MTEDALFPRWRDSIKQFLGFATCFGAKRDNYYRNNCKEKDAGERQNWPVKEVPVIIKDFSDQEIVEISLIENIQH